MSRRAGLALAIVAFGGWVLLYLWTIKLEKQFHDHLVREVCFTQYAVAMNRIGDAFAARETSAAEFTDDWVLTRMEFGTLCKRRNI
jgi:hypothetical protein